MEVIFKVQGSTIRGARGKIRNLSHHRFWSDLPFATSGIAATGVPKSEKSGTKTPYEDEDTIGGGKIDGSGTMNHVAVSISPSDNFSRLGNAAVSFQKCETEGMHVLR